MEKLFERGRIGSLELKNRVVMPAMGCSFAQADGTAGEQIIRYYQARARGGAGLIITEVTRVDDETGVALPCQLSVTDLKFIPGLTRLADAVHAYDAKIFIQLHHPGNQTPSSMLHGAQPVSASDVVCKTIGEAPRALSTEEVEQLVNKFAGGAAIARRAGMDGVEIHAAHGYLVNQFMSPHANKRTDKYGGSFEGRMRFITEIIRGIQGLCGADFPISVRLNGEDFIEDGIRLDEAVRMAVYLEKLGIQCLNVSCGTYESAHTIIEPSSFDEGWKKHLARAVKERVSIPVIAVNNIKHPAVAEALLKEGVCDFIGVARGFLADAEWAGKAVNGNASLIRNCIGCMECFRVLNECRPLECTVNPVLGREYLFGEDKLERSGGGRKVAVIGGGPAGMQAAITLAKRGYKPVLIERQDRLGGSVNLADQPPHKQLLTEFTEALKAELEALDVEVLLNTEGSAALCRRLGAEGVFLATGGKPIVPDVPGVGMAFTSTQILTREVEPEGKAITVVGGGVTGLETAEFLCAKNRVTVIEMAGEVGAELYASARALLLKRLDEAGVKILTRTTLKAVTDGGVLVTDADGGERTIPADMAVLAMGVRADRALQGELENAFGRVVLVGDAERPAQIRQALHSALDKAFVY